MNNNDLKERIFSQTTTGKRLENGMWELTSLMIEKVIYLDGTEKEEKIETMCVDADFDVAHTVALKSSLEELGFLVYSRKFDSLIEGAEYQRKLEQEHDSPKDNPDTSTQ